MDPHHFGKLDPYPHQSGKLSQDQDAHQSEKPDADPDPHQSEKWKPLKVILEHWRVQIWKMVSGRIRIRTKLKERIRIRIRNTGKTS
jgi:hypothetical protein